MSHRFYSEQRLSFDPANASVPVLLQGDEAHHLSRVMRAAVGDRIVLFDGSGTDFHAKIVSVRKHEVELEILSQELGRVPDYNLTLAVALPKGDRQHWLVEKITEIGVTKLIPLKTERGVASAAQASERLHRWMIEACKQCERSRVMEITEPTTLSELAADAAPGQLRLVAHPQGASLSATLNTESSAAASVLVAIGPEGGFADHEVQQLEAAGFQAIGLGPLILRVETAAIAVAAAVGLGSNASYSAS